MTQSVHLLVDVGNSRLKWNCLTATDCKFHHPARAFPWSIDELPGLLDKHWEAQQEFVTEVFISSVAGSQVQEIISQWCFGHWNVQAQFASTTREFAEIKNGYDRFQELGVDRWMAVIAAHRLYADSTNIIIDCGSATTVDTVMPTGEHRAGPILSVDKNLLEGLLSQTDLSASLSEKGILASDMQQDTAPPQVFVNNTKTAILSGVKFATSNPVEQIVSQIEAELSMPGDINLIATGGDAQNLMALSKLSSRKNYFYEPDLVLKGLAYFFNCYNS